MIAGVKTILNTELSTELNKLKVIIQIYYKTMYEFITFPFVSCETVYNNKEEFISNGLSKNFCSCMKLNELVLLYNNILSSSEYEKYNDELNKHLIICEIGNNKRIVNYKHEDMRFCRLSTKHEKKFVERYDHLEIFLKFIVTACFFEEYEYFYLEALVYLFNTNIALENISVEAQEIVEKFEQTIQNRGVINFSAICTGDKLGNLIYQIYDLHLSKCEQGISNSTIQLEYINNFIYRCYDERLLNGNLSSKENYEKEYEI